MSEHLTIGFLGAGKMGTALATGFIRAGLVNAAQIFASDPVEPARTAFARDVGAKIATCNSDVAKFATVLLLAVKPDQVHGVLTDIRDAFTPQHLLISIAAGVPIAKLEAALNPGARVIRIMPNTPALVGLSATAYTPGKSALPEDTELARKLFSAVGIAFPVKEYLLDAVTGLSGSGPAYVYLMIEALSDGGVAAGLPRDIATKLAAQTLLGAAKMVLETGLHPGALKDMVTSPGGTTIEGLHELEKGKVRAALPHQNGRASFGSRSARWRSPPSSAITSPGAATATAASSAIPHSYASPERRIIHFRVKSSLPSLSVFRPCSICGCYGDCQVSGDVFNSFLFFH
jgi:pyrroline-5-carboxylate reductase